MDDKHVSPPHRKWFQRRIDELAEEVHRLRENWLPAALDEIGKYATDRTCEPGWDSYGAEPVTPAAVWRAQICASLIYTCGLPRPTVVPTNRGGVALNWEHDDSLDMPQMDIEVNTGGRFIFTYHTEDGDNKESGASLWYVRGRLLIEAKRIEDRNGND